MQKSTNNQKLILISGLTNGGKTFVYNLIKNEDNFIYLEFMKHHFHIYEEEMINQIGKKNVERLKPLIDSKDILYSHEIFAREVGLLMKEFPEYNFLIKPIRNSFPHAQIDKKESWIINVKKYMPIKFSNIHYLYIVRHPKISWFLTQGISFEEFMHYWSDEDIFKILEFYDLVKVEDIKNHKFLKSIIKKINLENLKPYTEFDYEYILGKNNDLGFKNYDNINEEFKIIENTLADTTYKALGYELEEETVKLFCKDFIKYCQENGDSINEVFYRYSE